MSEFVKLILKNWIFVKLLGLPILSTLDNIKFNDLTKYSENLYVAKNFQLNDTLEFSEVSFFTGSSFPGEVISFSFESYDPSYYINSDYYFDSSLNDWEEYGDRSKLRGVGRNRKNYTDRIDGYKIKLSVSPSLSYENVWVISVDLRLLDN